MIAAEEEPHRPPTRMAMVILGLVTAYLVAARASRDALFLSQFSASNLPAMVAVAAIGAVAMSMLGSRMLVRLGPNRMTVFSFALSGVMQVAEWMLFGYRPHIAACVIYVHVVSFGAVLVSAFWSLMNESFEPRVGEDGIRKDQRVRHARRVPRRVVGRARLGVVFSAGGHSGAGRAAHALRRPVVEGIPIEAGTASPRATAERRT